MTLQKLERHLWAAADFLRGKIDSSDYKHYILGLLFYKSLCDVWHEEHAARLAARRSALEPTPSKPDEHRFHIPCGAFWREVRAQRTGIGRALNQAFRQIEEANPRLEGIFRNANFDHPERLPDRTLDALLNHFDQLPFGRRHQDRDLLGNAYEVLIAHFANDAGKKGGEFYTPKSVSRLLIEGLEPQEGMTLYDPACGSGGLLLEAVHHLKRDRQDPSKLRLYGQEMNLNTWTICRINLFLHNIDNAFIAHGDTLRHPKHLDPERRLMRFDRVVANPPFSLRNWGHEDWKHGDPFARNLYACPPRNFGDLAFLQHMLKSLAPDGRLAVVLPHGVLFRGGVEQQIRKGLVRDDLIEALVGLPPGLFYGTSISACILFIRPCKPAARQGNILIIDGSRDPGPAPKGTLNSAHVDRLLDALRQAVDEPGFSKIVPLDHVRAQNYDLSIARYVHDEITDEILDVERELDVYRRLCQRRDLEEQKLLQLLKTLRHDS